jgi:hypothetical protein
MQFSVSCVALSDSIPDLRDVAGGASSPSTSGAAAHAFSPLDADASGTAGTSAAGATVMNGFH